MSPEDWETQCQTCCLTHLEKSKEPGAGWNSLQQSENYSLGSWCVSTENASKEHVSYCWIMWCNRLILLCWVVVDLALECHPERPEITAEESQGYTAGCSGSKGGVDETHKPCRKPQVREPSGLPEEPSQMPTPVNFQHLSQPKGNGTLVVPDKWNLSCYLLLLLLLSPNLGEAKLASRSGVGNIRRIKRKMDPCSRPKLVKGTHLEWNSDSDIITCDWT